MTGTADPMTTRKRRPAPARTPVKVTDRRRNQRTGRLEAWAAESLDGLWTYVRTEDERTTWEVRHRDHGHGFALAGSRNGARELTASGAALRVIERMEAELAARLAGAA